MAAVAGEKKDPGAKFATQVDEQIAQATNRIRVHDLTLGGLTLAAMVAVYATAVIVLDRYLNLPEWVRQLSLAGFVTALSAVGYLLILRPLRLRINPLYAAAKVEDTIEDAKNSVTGYVEAQETGRAAASVKAAMSARAARAVGEADVNRAVDHRNLLIAGGVLVLFLVTLAVLFFVFRPTQFRSLVGRAFVPFSSAPIATRTQLTLTKPDNPEPTLTTGQTITVAVYVGGRVPAQDSPERVRLLLRHNPADPNFEQIPMVEGDSNRDWQVKVPEYLVQNGFWYKVAAGDAETREYHVSVRSLPLFTDFEVSYEYPKYTRRPPEKGTDPNLRAYRGTKITLRARANRDVADGWMRFEAAGLAPVRGSTTPDRKDTLGFTFTATEPTRYRLFMTTVSGETNPEPPPFQISLDTDSPPRVEITKPEEPETTVPANGQLAVDGTVGDDFGIDKVRLRLRVDGRDLAPLFYEGGKSFRRDADGTWPNDLAYKGSADLTKLSYADGAKEQFSPKENMALEYWLEAIDNCTETKPVEGWGEKPQPGQVGKSEVRKVRLTAPKTEAEEKEQLNQQKEQRQNEEQQHNQQQQQKLEKEDRQPPNKPQDGKQEQDKKEEGKKEEGKPEAKQDQPADPNAAPKDNPKDDGKKGDRKEEKKGKGGMGDAGGDSNAAPMPKEKKDGTPPPKNPEAKKKDAGGAGEAGTEPKATEPPGTGTPPKKDGKQEGKTEPKGGAGGQPMQQPKADQKPDGKSEPKGMPEGGTGGGTGQSEPKKADTAPMPKTQEDRQTEKKAEQVQNELDKNKGKGGDAKPSQTADAEKNRTDPAEAKKQPPQPMPGSGMESESKEGPPPADPKANPMDKDKGRAAESRGEGNLEKPADPNPDQKPQPDAKAKPSENREAPLGGAAGEDKPKPEPKPEPKPGDKKDTPGTQPKQDDKKPKEDPQSGSTGKPAGSQPPEPSGKPGMNQDDARPNPADEAGTTKPNVEPARGQDKNLPKSKNGPPPGQKPDPKAGEAKPQQSEQPAGTKPPPPKDDDMAGQGGESDPKAPPKDPNDRKGEGAAAESRTPPKPMNQQGGRPDDKGVQPGTDKEPPAGESPPQGSDNADKKNPKAGGGSGKQPDEKKLKELQDAARDLNSPDEKKRAEAEKKLDDAVGKEKRKELQQMEKDLQSKDEATRKAAEQKLEKMKEDLERQAEQQAKKDANAGRGAKKGKGEKGPDFKEKELSPQEVADLAKKAQDLNSKDQNARRAAEDALDEKIGKEAREKLQEEMKNQPPMDQKQIDELKKKIEEQAKKNPEGKGPRQEDLSHGGGRTGEKPNPADPTDPRNKARTAQLQLEDFEKHRYDPDLHEKLGWTQPEYEEFLKKAAERTRQLQKEAEAFEKEQLDRPAPTGEPTITPGGPGKVETRANNLGLGASGGAAGFAPAGFEDAKKRFAQEAMKKAGEKK